MAGDDDSDRVRGAGAGDGADGGGPAQGLSELRVASGFSAGNAAERLPDAHLERCGAEVERQIECGGMLRELRENQGQRGIQTGFGMHLSGRKLCAQLARELAIVVA